MSVFTISKMRVNVKSQCPYRCRFLYFSVLFLWKASHFFLFWNRYLIYVWVLLSKSLHVQANYIFYIQKPQIIYSSTRNRNSFPNLYTSKQIIYSISRNVLHLRQHSLIVVFLLQDCVLHVSIYNTRDVINVKSQCSYKCRVTGKNISAVILRSNPSRLISMSFRFSHPLRLANILAVRKNVSLLLSPPPTSLAARVV
jgi:hypothetical protein